MPTFTKTKTFAASESPIASADLNSIGNDVASFLNVTKLDSDNIQDLGITSGKLAGSITASKLAATTPGYVLLGTTTTGVPTFTALSGDITVTGGGVTAIGAGKVVTAMIADGDVETAKINDLAVTTGKLAADAVDGTKIADDAVDTEHIADDAVENAQMADNSVDSAQYVDNSIDAEHLATNALTLGYTQITGNLTTTATSATQATGLTQSVTIPSGGRKVEIEAYVGGLSSSAGGATSVLSIWDGTVGSGTQLSAFNVGGSNVAFLHNQGAVCKAVVTPAAGSKTYNVGFHTNGGTLTLNASSVAPAYIHVKVV